MHMPSTNVYTLISEPTHAVLVHSDLSLVWLFFFLMYLPLFCVIT